MPEIPPKIPMPILAGMIKNKKKRASRKQLTWLKYYIETGNATQSAMRAYHVRATSAFPIAKDNLASLDYGMYLEQAGITDHLLTESLRNGLEAKRIVSSGNTDTVEAKTQEYPDYAVRHKYLETAYKLKKRLDAPTTTP